MVKIRDASLNDFAAINALMNSCSMEFKKHEEWAHLWKNNPIISAGKKAWPIGWVLENDDKQIVGYLGNIPVAYEFKGRKLTAAVATSWAVDTAYRSYSILLIRNYFFAQKYAHLFVAATADYKSGEVLSAFRAQKPPVDSCDIPLFSIINCRRFIASALLKKKVPLSSMLSYPLSLAMGGFEKLTKRNRYIDHPPKEIQCYGDFDERFDVFWNNLKRRYHGRLLCVRDHQYLNWHFAYAIAQKKIWIFVVEDKSEIVAYAIFVRYDNPNFKLRRVRLVDFQAIDENSDILTKMISLAIRKCRKENIHMLETLGFNSQKRAMLKNCLPYKRKLSTHPFFYSVKDKFLAKELENPKAWDPCLFDGDASL